MNWATYRATGRTVYSPKIAIRKLPLTYRDWWKFRVINNVVISYPFQKCLANTLFITYNRQLVSFARTQTWTVNVNNHLQWRHPSVYLRSGYTFFAARANGPRMWCMWSVYKADSHWDVIARCGVNRATKHREKCKYNLHSHTRKFIDSTLLYSCRANDRRSLLRLIYDFIRKRCRCRH